MQHTLRRQQAGFTLVEIAIVLVIIGLLLGGVLKGQELIENAKIKSITSDMKAVQTAFNGYLDRYKSMPGDETAATMTARGFAGAAGAATADNGVLNVTLAQTFTNGGDQAAFWRALRASGLIVGDPTIAADVSAALPKHAGGGLLGVTGDPLGVYGQPGISVCAAGLSAKQAAGVDALIDGAAPAAPNFANTLGSVRAATAAANPLAPTAAAPAGANFDESAATTWTVCMLL